MWSSHNFQYSIKNKRINAIEFKTFFEDAKQLFRSSDIRAKVLEILRKLHPINGPAHIDVTAESKRALRHRIATAIGWSFIAQLLLALQFHIIVNINYNLVDWSSNIILGMKSVLYMRHLIPISICIISYDFLISEFYMLPIPLYFTRSDHILYVGGRKILLLGAQLLLSLWYFHVYCPQSENPHLLYMQYTMAFVTVHNFWKTYLFQEPKLNFGLVVTPGYEQLCLILRPSFRPMFQRVFSPWWKFTLTYLIIVNIENLAEKYGSPSNDWSEFNLYTIDISTVFQTLLITAQTQQTILTLESLIRFKLTQPMEFAVKYKAGKALLLEALDTRDYNQWIFDMATRDFLSLSQDQSRYQDLFIIPNQETQYLWEDISGLSLEIVRQYTKELRSNYESPEKLMDKILVERALNDTKSKDIFIRAHDRDNFIVSLLKAPKLCCCPLGPLRPMTPTLLPWLTSIFWFHIELAYKLLMRSKILHLWHYLFCPTFGVRVRYLLKDTEPIESLLHGVTNICIAAYKENERFVIKSTILPFLKVLLDVIEVSEKVPYNTHELFGLNAEAYSNLKSLKTYAKSSLFRLLQCYQDQLMLFVQDDTIQDIDRIVELYKWPIKMRSSRPTNFY